MSIYCQIISRIQIKISLHSFTVQQIQVLHIIKELKKSQQHIIILFNKNNRITFTSKGWEFFLILIFIHIFKFYHYTFSLRRTQLRLTTTYCFKHFLFNNLSCSIDFGTVEDAVAIIADKGPDTFATTSYKEKTTFRLIPVAKVEFYL